MKEVRFGLIGHGNMGTHHAGYLNDVDGACLTAVADRDPEKREKAKAKNPDVDIYEDGAELIRKAKNIDAVLIATPHYDHPPLTKAAFKKGLHVLCEKPVAVTAAAADKVNKAYAKMKKKPVYGAMFQQRTRPDMQAVKRMIDDGTIGELKKVVWLINDWFRTQAYYDSGGWRATWSGEGGGVLINQCPHNLDLLTWFCGLPKRVIAIASLGRYHNIEVEDDVTALLEYENGATGVFVTSTGEAPGTNRLEIHGDKGKLVLGDGQLTLTRLHTPASEFCAKSPNSFATPAQDKHIIEVGGKSTGHRGITENFVGAILRDEPLLASATEGIKGLELGNAMLMSGLLGEPVKIPTPRAKFEQMLKEMGEKSTFTKKVRKAKVDMGASF
jgi:predicted dehydrogenase